MLFIKIIGYEVHLAKWPKGTFISTRFFRFSKDEVIIRLGLFELEINKQIVEKGKLL